MSVSNAALDALQYGLLANMVNQSQSYQHYNQLNQLSAALSQSQSQPQYVTFPALPTWASGATPDATDPAHVWWADIGERGTPQTTLMVLRAYLLQHGMEADLVLTMPPEYLRELCKAFRKLETGNIDTELVYGMMDDENKS